MIEKLAIKPRLTSEERRASIVRSAMHLFAEKGFRGTTTRELAAAVGVSEPVLYEHFRTKSDLYSAIIDTCTSEGLPVLEAFRERYLVASDDISFFTELAGLIFKWHEMDPTFIRLLLFSNLENHELRDQFHQRMSIQFLTLISDYIVRRQREGAFREVNAELAARAFSGMVGQYALMGIVFGCPLPLPNDEVIQGMVGIFLEGLCKREAA